MNESAPSLRERRKADTARSLTTTAREWAVDRGLTGFTIEELCEAVGVSRRTFFNYFPSKESAVLGLPDRRATADLEEAFASGHDLDGAVAPDAGLLEQAEALHLARWARVDLQPAEAQALIAVVGAEPRLFAHILELAAQNELDDIRLLERRAGLAEGDLLAASAVQLLGTVARTAAAEYFDAGNRDSYLDIHHRRLAAFRDLLTATTSRSTS